VPSVLLLRQGEGWAVPKIDSEERRSADVAELNRAVEAALGLEVSVLRCLSDEPAEDGSARQQLYALEAHGTPRPTPAGGRWVAPGELDGMVPARSQTRRFLDAWLLTGSSFSVRADVRDWIQPGWRDEVLAWVGAELHRRGLPTVSKVEQIRVWEFSQVLRLGTDAGAFYLKARPASGAAEPLLTLRLAERHPVSAPAVIAVKPDRRWLLMRATSGPPLMQVDELARWETAAATIAYIQIDWLEATAELAALGCRRWTLGALEAEIAPLLADVTALQPRHAEGLTDEEVVALHRSRPALEDLCRELAGEGVPESLEHGDLWGENVIAGDVTTVFIDWEDAAIAHPFFTPALLLLSLDYTEALARVPDARRRVREAYLSPWRERGPLARWPLQRLERVFDLAQEVALVHYAAQFRRALPLIETSWEVRAFLPLFLRRLASNRR
jgi:hypothetical protein